MLLTSGRITNPTLNQVLVDTGPLAARERTWQAIAAATVNVALEVQYVAADGTTVLKSQIIAVPAFSTARLPPMVADMIPMALNERVRIIAVAAATGSASCSLEITT